MALPPARITLQYALEQRQRWLAALEAASSGASYSIDGQTLTRRDVDEINSQIARWDDTVKTLDLRARGIVRKMSARASAPTPGSGTGGLYPQALWEDWRT
jgi:hypothetical protein